MKKKLYIFVALIIAILGVTSCSDKVTKEAAKKAGETLQKWKQQNK